jgi:hypothetical protein
MDPDARFPRRERDFKYLVTINRVPFVSVDPLALPCHVPAGSEANQQVSRTSLAGLNH